MKEWSNPWNPFNSAKVLLWKEHLEACAEEDYLPPVTVDVDPSNRCMFDCPHCFDGNEEITLSDFSTKKMSKLIPGDFVWGLNKKGKMIPTKVVKVYDNGITENMIKFTFEDGDTFLCTPEHKIWHSRGRWKQAKNFHIGETVKKAFRHNRILYDSDDYKKGYVAGISEGDGCLWLSKNRKSKRTYRFRLFMNDMVAMETFADYCTDFGILWHWGYHQYRGHKDYQKDQIFKKKALWITSDVESRKIKNIIETKNQTQAFKIGWLAGMFDAEGSDSGSIRISQSYKNKDIRKKIIMYCSDLNYKIKEEKKGIRIYADRYNRINFYLDLDIQIKRKFKNALNQKVKCRKKIVNIGIINGIFDKYDIETETHNYLVKGVLVHNCNAYDMMQRSSNLMSGEHMVKLVNFLVHWRGSTRHNTPMSACISGGGEPYMNKEMTTLLEAMYENGMEPGIITTGYPMTSKDIDVAAITARWVGFSVDAANTQTYQKVKGIESGKSFNKVIESGKSFNKVIENIKKLVKRVEHHKSKCDVAYKFLLTPDNANEVYAAIKLAKEIGVKDFHLRPAGWDNLSKVTEKPKFDHNVINYINDQIEAGMGLEDKNFRVFGIRHKFNPDFSRKINFSRCWAIPLIPTFGADGNVHLCFDMRGRKDLILCRHDPDPYELLRFWNTDRHREVIRSVKVEDCPRCTFGAYNEIVEKVIIDDSMCKYFP